MKKLILLGIPMLFMSVQSFGGYFGHEVEGIMAWHTSNYGRADIHVNVYVNKTGNFQIFTEHRGTGRAITTLYGQNNIILEQIQVAPYGSDYHCSWNYHWSQIRKNIYVSRYTCYSTFLEPGVTTPPSYSAAACGVYGWALH